MSANQNQAARVVEIGGQRVWRTLACDSCAALNYDHGEPHCALLSGTLDMEPEDWDPEDDSPPEWCPLRKGPVLMVLE